MLKQILASAAMTAAALATIPATAQEGPNLTDAEKATMKAYGDLRSCTQEGMQAVAKEALPVVKQIVEARAKAGDKATADAAKTAGMTAAQADLLSKSLAAADTEALMIVIVQGEQASQMGACAKKLGIANKEGTGFSKEFSDKMSALNKKLENFVTGQPNHAPAAPGAAPKFKPN